MDDPITQIWHEGTT